MRVNGRRDSERGRSAAGRLPRSATDRARAGERIFPNCPRYIHKMAFVEQSPYAPRPNYTPPDPDWKSYDVFSDALPRRAEDQG